MEKKMIKKIMLIVTMAMSMFIGEVAHSQNTNSPTSAVSTNEHTIAGGLQQIWDALTDGNTNWYFSVHGLYAPKLQEKWGAGVGAYYPLSKYVVAGVRVDWVNGGFWMPSGNAALQTKIHPLKFIPEFSVTPFVYVGVGIPLSGAKFGDVTIPGSVVDNNGEPTVILGYGAAASLWQDKARRISLNLVFDTEDWDGFEGKQYRGGLLINYKF